MKIHILIRLFFIIQLFFSLHPMGNAADKKFESSGVAAVKSFISNCQLKNGIKQKES